MLVSDTAVIMKEDGSVTRPSDVGECVLCTDCIDILMSSGASFMLTEDFYVDFGNEKYYPFEDIDKSRKFSLREYDWTPDSSRWERETKYDLGDFIPGAHGVLDIDTEEFAYLAGFLCAAVNKRLKYPYAIRRGSVKKETMSLLENYLTIDTSLMKYVVLKTNKMFPVFDSIFDLSCPSIPDSILFKAPDDWVDKFLDGVITGCAESSGEYNIGSFESKRWLLNDLSIWFLRRRRFIRAIFTSGELSFKLLEKPGATKICYGKYLRGQTKQLYDIGSGIYNLSGMKILSK